MIDTVDHDDWLADLRERLTQTRDEHSAQLSHLTAQSPDPGEAANHAAMLAAARQSLADTSAALQRMADGRYGRCESCGGAIPAERLEIIPHARTCVPCRH
jgi:RNA polymerase-binding transcription factor DksA